MRTPFLCVVACVAMLLSACSSVTPMMRIEENPAVFASLSPKEQALVQKGEISEGMSPAAVYIAWGAPDGPAVYGEKDGKKYTKWVYTALLPVYNPTPSFWGGPHWGPRGWYGGGAMWNDVTYIPVNVAYVLFENGKVTAWEAKNKRPAE